MLYSSSSCWIRSKTVIAQGPGVFRVGSDLVEVLGEHPDDHAVGRDLLAGAHADNISNLDIVCGNLNLLTIASLLLIFTNEMDKCGS